MEFMHIKYFTTNVRRIPSLSTAKIYVNRDGAWHDVSEEQGQADSVLSKSFNTLSSDYPFAKIKSPSRAIFLLSDPKICAVLPIGAKTHNDTLTRHHHRFDECLTAATSSFHAHYDELTNVLNRHGIRFNLALETANISLKDRHATTSESKITAKNDIVLYAFDIDRFKSVNDTLGHAAGDIVLASFSSRLNSFANSLHNDYSAKFIFGRPGGEEFELICIGSFSAQEREQIGVELLKEIRRPLIHSIPNSKNFSASTISGSLKDRLTQTSGITASIGVSWRTLENTEANIEDLHSNLRKEADAGLYRAKADGRDCLRAYEDIKLKHGRVMMYHPDSSLVEIDIGAKVGVVSGDIFSVFFHPFTGNEKIKESEKSLKILGSYPAIECAKIRAISIEDEVSICEILQFPTEKQIPLGSRLRYVHVGSKYIESTQITNISSFRRNPNGIENHIDYLKDTEQLSAVLLLSSLKDINSRNGLVDVSEITLALSISCPPGSKVFSSLGGFIYVVIPNTHVKDDKDLRNSLEKIQRSISRIREDFSINACIFSDLPLNFSKKANAILFYCKSLLKALNDGNEKLRIFNQYSPTYSLNEWRHLGDIENMLIDYREYIELGVNDAHLHNEFGVAVIENEVSHYYNLGAIAFQMAIDAEPDNLTFHANHGVLLTRLGLYSEAYDALSKAKDWIFKESVVYSVCLAKAALELKKTNIPFSNELLSRALHFTASSSNPFKTQKYFHSLYEEVAREVSLA